MANRALESVQIIEILVGELIGLLQLLPEATGRLLQVCKLRVAVDPKRCSECWNFRKVSDVARVEIQVLD